MSVNSVWFDDFQKALPSLEGKRVAITGTTSGTGQSAARACVKLGAEVFMLNRESGRAQAALKMMQAARVDAKVHHIPCDLMDFSSVRAAAKTLGQLVIDQGLDVLCCNAGVMMSPDEATVDGYDVQMQTNHLSHFLLVKDLMPCLQVAARLRGEARVIQHSSLARRGASLEAKYLGQNGGKLKGTGMSRYHHSKLANVVFTFALAAKLKAAGQDNIKALVCCPGFSDTNLLDDSIPCTRLFCCVKKCMLQSAEDGSMPLLACIAKEGVSCGEFYVPSSNNEHWGPPVKLERPLKDRDVVCEKAESFDLLWRESEKATETFAIR